jgi:DNA-binding transcriptional LysR family regulator
MSQDRHQLSAWPGLLDLTKLATLHAVVAHGSFSAAGKALALTQPAVSRQIALLERQAGTQLVWRTRQGVHPTEAGRLLAGHAEAILARLALAEGQLAELAGMRRGRVHLGSFFTALVYLSAEAGAVLGERHPELVIVDQLVDREAALAGLATGELDVALVFEHDFEPAHVSGEVEIVPLFEDPSLVLLPASHPLCARTTLMLEDLADETWVRAYDGSAARLVDHVLQRAGLTPRIVLAGHGDEPAESQALVAAGSGIALSHELTVIVDRDRVAARPLVDGPRRMIQAVIMRGQRAPAARALLDALQEVGRMRTLRSRTGAPGAGGARRSQAASRSKARTAS